MRKLALSDDILLSVEKPARYIGGEMNMVMKQPEDVDIRFAMCFPDVYEVGMSHLGIQILYDMFNKRKDTWCERVYSPWVDLDRIMKERKIPLFALESQDPVRSFDFLGITLQYEMCYTNVLQILDLAQIPLHTCDRTEQDPIVIGGGPCAYNPEPIAEFFDFFYIGEGETAYDDIFDLYKNNRKNGGSRADFLRQVSHIPGMYVPSLYRVSYHDDKTLKSFEPIYEDVPKTIRKQVVTDLDECPYPEKQLVPFLKVVQDRVVLELQRGCTRGCRFCQAGMIYRPNRERSVPKLMALANSLLDTSGQDEINLSSLSSSDFSDLPELAYGLIDECKRRHVTVSLPSLRIDNFAIDVMKKVSDVYRTSITFAPEAGTQRMRNVINKGLTEEEILDGAYKAFLAGWNKVKLYFMLGLPTETEDDVKGIALLAEEIAKKYYTIPKEERKGKVNVTISTSYFIAKPFTPFQWMPMISKETFLEHQKLLKATVGEQLNHKSLEYHWHDAETSELEGIFARGDRTLSAVIEDAYRAGCMYDAWTEHFRYDIWKDCMNRHGVSVDFYNLRERPKDELLPWDFIDIGVRRNFLYQEYEKAKQEIVTPNCMTQCSGCGASVFDCGICKKKMQEKEERR